jgi:hypothetical protein
VEQRGPERARDSWLRTHPIVVASHRVDEREVAVAQPVWKARASKPMVALVNDGPIGSTQSERSDLTDPDSRRWKDRWIIEMALYRDS